VAEKLLNTEYCSVAQMPQPQHNRPAWIDHDVNKQVGHYTVSREFCHDGRISSLAPCLLCAPGLIQKVVPNLHIAAPLACACRHSMLRAHNVSGRAEQRPQYGTIQSSCTPFLLSPYMSSACFLQPHLASGLLWWDP
jgi:hypothetical protein